MEFINAVGHTYFINNILPHFHERLYGFNFDAEESIRVEGYTNDGYPMISSFYGNEFIPKFIALIKLTLEIINDKKLRNHITTSDKEWIKNIKNNYNDNHSIITQVYFFQVDDDIKVLDKTPIEVK